MEFESDDHELCLWLRVEKKQEDSPPSLACKAGQSGTKIACGMDVINTRRSAGTILTGCNYAGHCPKEFFHCPINNILYGR